MTQDIQMLNQIRQTTQMGQVGIRAVRKYTPTSAFDNAMQTQYVEYDRICKDADRLLEKHCGTPKNLSPLARAGAAMSARFVARTDEKGSQIAKMMIEGNTKGMIKACTACIRFSRKTSRSLPWLSGCCRPRSTTSSR